MPASGYWCLDVRHVNDVFTVPEIVHSSLFGCLHQLVCFGPSIRVRQTMQQSVVQLPTHLTSISQLTLQPEVTWVKAVDAQFTFKCHGCTLPAWQSLKFTTGVKRVLSYLTSQARNTMFRRLGWLATTSFSQFR